MQERVLKLEQQMAERLLGGRHVFNILDEKNEIVSFCLVSHVATIVRNWILLHWGRDG